MSVVMEKEQLSVEAVPFFAHFLDVSSDGSSEPSESPSEPSESPCESCPPIWTLKWPSDAEDA